MSGARSRETDDARVHHDHAEPDHADRRPPTGLTAKQIIWEAHLNGLDPVEHCLDLADGFGWDEDMTEAAVNAIRVRTCH